MKKRMWQRGLCLLLALQLVLGNVPLNTPAQEVTEPPVETAQTVEETQTKEVTETTEVTEAAEETQPETAPPENAPRTAAVTDDTADIFRWENTGTDLVSTHGGNALTKRSGTITGGVLNGIQFALETPVVLLHHRPWALEWKASGHWNGMLLAREAASATLGNNFLFKTGTDSGLIAFGEKTDTTYYNYGVALTERNINTDLSHTYRIENRIASDGSNMAYLLVDGTELGPMNRFFLGGSSDQGTAVDWLNGRDFTFSCMGTSGHAIEGCALEYLTVWEGEHSHSFTDGTCTQCGEIRSLVPEGWNPVPISTSMESKHLGYQIQDGVLTFHDFAQPDTVGFGILPDYTNTADVFSKYDLTPWYQARGGITQVIFDETISYIGTYTLTNMDKLTRIQMDNPEAKLPASAVLFSTTARETPLEIYAHSTVQTVDGWIRGNGYRKISEAIGEVTLFYADLAHLAPELAQLEENLEDPQALYRGLKLAGNISRTNHSVSNYRCAIPGAETALKLLWQLSSGSCGEGVSYRLEAMEQEGKLNLILSGSGEMTLYPSTSSQPWYPVQESISDVTLADTVTNLDPGLFPAGAAYHVCLNSEAYRMAKENDLAIRLDKLRILCIGNSHTADYSEFLGNILKDLENAGLETDVQITRSIIGSIGLYSGRNSNKNATHRSRMESLAAKAGAYNYLKNNRYDLVIVQDYMESVVDTPDTFLPGLASYIQAVKQLAAGSGNGEPQIAWFADWVDIRATGGDTALYDGQGNKIQLANATRAEVYARALTNITAVQEAISRGTANMPDFVIQGSTLKQNAMSSYLGSSRMFDNNAYCLVERDTTHLTYELGRYLFGAGVLAKIVDHYRDRLAISGSSLDVGAALTLANGPVASGSGTQYSGAMTEELLAVIREIISSPDSFRQSAYTLDPAREILDQLLGVTWKLGEGDTQESVLSAIRSQVEDLLGSDGDKVTVTLANYVSPREFDLRFRVTHGYTVLEQTDTGHRCQYSCELFAPTATRQGYTAYTCATCGYSYQDSFVSPRGYDHMLSDGEFKLLLIGNSYSEDASNCGQGMTASQLLDILQAMLGQDIKVTVGLAYSGGKGLNWHATQADRGNAAHSLRTITTGETWNSRGNMVLKNALTWTDWDAVSLQHYNLNVSTGQESVPYPDTTDEKFYPMETAAEFLLDYVAAYAPQAETYFYMHWAQSSAIAMNANRKRYEEMAAYLSVVLDYAGTESGKRFETLIPVGLSVQNARSTYLSLLSYNTTAYADKNLNLTTDAQIGLQRDGGHLSFNIGRYIAALTFAETILPRQLRTSSYTLPDIRLTESIGRLPKEYTTISQKAVTAAVDAWLNRGSLAVTAIAGYEQDPTVAAAETLTALTVPCAMDLTQLQERIGKAALDLLGTDFAVDKVILPEDFVLTGENQEVTATVTFRFGYTGVTGDVAVTVGSHSYGPWDQVTAPTCDAEGQDQRTCISCGEKQYRDTRISGDPNKIQVSDPVAEDFFAGKILMAIGDSITAGTGTTAEERYHYLAARALGMTNINSGTSGAVLCPGGHLPNKFADLMTEELLTKRNVDVVTIALGINDWDNGVVNGTYQGKLKYDPSATYYGLGTFGTDDTTTIYGAAKMWCERILELKATESCRDIQFIFLTPVITSYNKSLTTAKDWNQDKTNVFGYTLRQYCTAIMEVCAYYGIPVLDMNLYSGMYYHSETDNNVNHFGGDGIHPGPNGHAMMADALAEFLREGYGYEIRRVENCGHSYEAIVTAPTCTEGGFTTNRCPDCHYSFVSNETPATGHKEVTDKAVAATCTESGLTEGSHCETCGQVFRKQEEIPALSHSYQDTLIPPTATERGFTAHTCSVCGYSYADSYTDELGQLSDTAEVLSDGERIVLTPLNSVMHHKCLIFSGSVADLGEGVIRLGHGKTLYASSYLELTADVLRVCTKASTLSTTEYAHGLTLEGNVKVRIEVGQSSTTVNIETPGGTFKRKISWSGKNGEIFCETEGTELTNVDLRWYCSKADAPIWLFGDSWFSTTSTARWTSYLLGDGHSDVLLSGYGGNGAPAAYEQFRNMLEIDTPEYAVWCMGMNNGDRNGTLNSGWVTATEKFIALCEEKGIIPILATIPTTPKVNNRLKNAWVKASGYRYIDFDLALVQNHVTGEWYEGTAASDLNHPTTAGAKLLYPQLHADFPELAEGNREGCVHKLAYLQAKQPECVDGGRQAYYVCTLCAAAFLDEGATQPTTTARMLLAPAGHSNDEGTVTREATEEAEGEIRYTCTVCAAQTTEAIPKLPHTHKWLDSSAVIKECTACGHVEGGYRIHVEGEEAWIDGVKQKVYSNDTGTFVQLEHTNAKILTVYSYNDAAASDPHAKYPTGMQVWRLEFKNGGYVSTCVPEFENLLQYAGASIRVTGVKGIRMITGISKALRSKLMDGFLGYTLVEYGTAVAWASELNGAAPVLGQGSTMHNYAYKQGVADPIFADTGDTIQYTNVLVGFADDQLGSDLVMRPYIILENAAGERITLYGGCVQRSIGYIAKQNQSTFPEGTKADAYIEDIISKVYK